VRFVRSAQIRAAAALVCGDHIRVKHHEYDETTVFLWDMAADAGFASPPWATKRKNALRAKHPDAKLIALGEAFARLRPGYLAARDHFNLKAESAHDLACQRAGIAVEDEHPTRKQVEAFAAGLEQAFADTPGANVASEKHETLAKEIEGLAQQIMDAPCTRLLDCASRQWRPFTRTREDFGISERAISTGTITARGH
jgi:hypothetical protein